MPDVLKRLDIAEGQQSTIWDYRDETSPNGGLINLRACVWHIPVISNVAGRGDLDTLRRVLIQQGLMVQFGTDAEGNVALYTRPDRLCYHARGGNQSTCGVEQMHLTTGEPWTKRQLRAAGWIANYLEREFDIPLQMADVEPNGSGLVQIVRRGHTSHEQIARTAGFNDRSDPGDTFDYDAVFHNARYFRANGTFVGA